MPDPVQLFLTDWHRIVRERDLDALGAVLAADVTLGSPPYWEKLRGRPIVQHLLGLVIRTIEDFTYHREWTQGRELALEFTGHIGSLDIQGIDLITIGDNERIVNIDVLMRPVNTILALREVIAPQMLQFLSEMGRDDTSSPS
jgi:hypothetical protein